MIPSTPHGAGAALIDIGCSVFPVRGKIPYPGTRGCLDATRDYDILDAMFEGRPEAGVAIATGRVSGAWVFDVDGPTGADSLRCLEDQFGSLPATVTVHTPNGQHRYFEHVDGIRNTASKIAPGIDTRGAGGYVVCPPSQHPDGGCYRWAPDRSPFEVVPAAAPQWLLDLIVKKPEPEVFPEPREIPEAYGSRYVEAAIRDECASLARTGEGARNHRLNTAAYSLARFVADGKVDGATVARSLAFAAAQAGLGRREIEKTLHSAFRARGAA